MSKQPVLQMKNIRKIFPGVTALSGVNFEVHPNEIVGLVGENGAGKSTLMKILAGVYQADDGEIFLNGERVDIKSPQDAHALGIGMVFQEQAVLPNLTVYENIFFGNEGHFSRYGLMAKRKMIQEARAVLSEVGIDVAPDAYLHDLSFMERQMIEIARIFWLSRKVSAKNPIIVLDEPTTVLEEKEIKLLFERLKLLRQRASIIYISHRLSEVVELCDRVYVLKDGRNVGCFHRQEVSEDLLRSRMVGRDFHKEYYLIDEQNQPLSDVVLELRNCTKRGVFEDISFQLHRGEILSLCGTIGSGKEELCLALYGLLKLDTGEIFVEGKKVNIASPAQAFSLGIGYIPEDRRNEGLILNLPVFENMTLPVVGRLKKGVIVDRKKQVTLSTDMVGKLNIKTPSVFVPCFSLSGGNQQKVVLSKWLLSKVKILIMSHPTRGIDVGAKHEIYALIREMAKQGMAMILMGDSFEEDIGLAHRILVMKDGKISGWLDATSSKPTPADLIQYVV